MLSVEEVQAMIERGVQAFNSRDLDEWSADFDSEAELIPLRSATEGTYRGAAGARQFLADTCAIFEAFRIEEPRVSRIAGDLFLVSCRAVIRSRGAGVELTQPLANLLEVRDGKLASWISYGSEQDALAAAAERGST